MKEDIIDCVVVGDGNILDEVISIEELLAIVQSIERFEEEKRIIQQQIKDVYDDAKSRGYDAKALKEVIRLRKQDDDERKKHEMILDHYKDVLGVE